MQDKNNKEKGGPNDEIITGSFERIDDDSMLTVIKRLGDRPNNMVTAGWGEESFGEHDQLIIFIDGVDIPLVVRPQAETVIGRQDRDGTAPSVDLTRYAASDRGVSRRHAMLKRMGKTLLIIDLESSNGTFLNEQRLTPNLDSYVLHSGDTLRLGHLVMHLYFRPPQ